MDLKVINDNTDKSHRKKNNSFSTVKNRQNCENEALGWKAPVFKESRYVELDPEKLIKNHCVCFFPDAAPELTSYKLLRTHIILRCKPNNWNTVMITSALPGEGKTLTAINLAVTFAKIYGQTALLVDCDLQRQTIHQYLGISSPMGLADYLRNDISLMEIIFWPGVKKLSVISGGDVVYDSVELISSPKMVDLTKEMKNRYSDRYIFFDLPPLLAEPDALAFATQVDCILMVVHPKTSFDEVQKALAMIPQDKFLGFVLNQVDDVNDDYYGYKYRYGKQ